VSEQLFFFGTSMIHYCFEWREHISLTYECSESRYHAGIGSHPSDSVEEWIAHGI